MLKEKFDQLLAETLQAAREYYGERLVTFAVFGSVARNAQRFDSDVDLLLICDPLPAGRMRRMEEFQLVETRLEPMLLAFEKQGISTRLSPVFKTPEEVHRGSPLFLDLVEDARLLFGRDDFFKGYLTTSRTSLTGTSFTL
ncbi:MAG TPA: nucleotidyltransferase domain-containing protein [Candidatus Acidoferrales bacterium]|nr:nucleotidyltransferase domain-containing protein [Candidatus Acidoferrales bacterium]